MLTLSARVIFQSYDFNPTEMFRLTLLAFLLTFVALSYTNPTGDLFELEEEEDYGDYEQGIFENNPGGERTCDGRIELMGQGKSLR